MKDTFQTFNPDTDCALCKETISDSDRRSRVFSEDPHLVFHSICLHKVRNPIQTLDDLLKIQSNLSDFFKQYGKDWKFKSIF